MKLSKRIALILLVLALVFAATMGMIACKETPATTGDPQEEIVVDSDAVVVGYSAGGAIVISYDKAILADVSDKHFVDYLDALVEKGLFIYEATGGFVTTVCGKGVDSDNHEFWAIYTTDTANSSDAYSEPMVIDGKTYHSANFGITDMPLKEGESYAFKVSTW